MTRRLKEETGWEMREKEAKGGERRGKMKEK